jgi:hypothetical protein
MYALNKKNKVNANFRLIFENICTLTKQIKEIHLNSCMDLNVRAFFQIFTTKKRAYFP